MRVVTDDAVVRALMALYDYPADDMVLRKAVAAHVRARYADATAMRRALTAALGASCNVGDGCPDCDGSGNCATSNGPEHPVTYHACETCDATGSLRVADFVNQQHMRASAGDRHMKEGDRLLHEDEFKAAAEARFAAHSGPKPIRPACPACRNYDACAPWCRQPCRQCGGHPAHGMDCPTLATAQPRPASSASGAVGGGHTRADEVMVDGLRYRKVDGTWFLYVEGANWRVPQEPDVARLLDHIAATAHPRPPGAAPRKTSWGIIRTALSRIGQQAPRTTLGVEEWSAHLDEVAREADDAIAATEAPPVAATGAGVGEGVTVNGRVYTKRGRRWTYEPKNNHGRAEVYRGSRLHHALERIRELEALASPAGPGTEGEASASLDDDPGEGARTVRLAGPATGGEGGAHP